MATSSGITNIKASRSGHSIRYSADYAHTMGAAAETMDVAAGRVVTAQIHPLGTVNSQKISMGGSANVTSSTSGSVQTLTFNCPEAISAGTVSVTVELA
jgi:hypothetical protein